MNESLMMTQQQVLNSSLANQKHVRGRQMSAQIGSRGGRNQRRQILTSATGISNSMSRFNGSGNNNV